jgi:single-strand DNA-binding protein
MSWDINHVVLVGRLTKDPELTYTQSGAAVCKFSIAVNRSSGSGRSTGADGSGQDDGTSFFNIVTWNKTAEICKEYLSKGRQVGIDGRLQQRRWNAEDGSRRSVVEIVASTVQFFGPGRPSQDGYAATTRAEEQGRQESTGPRAEGFDAVGEREGAGEQDPFLSELDDDEIPF